MAKPINILHPIPKSDKPFALLPIGMYCNDKLQNAAPGSLLEFWRDWDWRHERRVLVRKCRIGINSSVFTFLAKSLYGERTRITDMIAKWREVYDVPFDESECMLIEVKEIEDE